MHRVRGLVRGSGICLAAIVPFLLLSAGSATAPAGAASRHASRAAAGDCLGKPGTGMLAVTVTIEPGHMPPVVNITGPGFKATINKSHTFCFAPGVYTVVGQPLRLPPDGGNPDGSTLYATVTGSPAAVLSGQTTPVGVDYGTQVPVTTKVLSNEDVTQHIASIAADEIVFSSLPASLKGGLHVGDVLVAGPTSLTRTGCCARSSRSPGAASRSRRHRPRSATPLRRELRRLHGRPVRACAEGRDGSEEQLHVRVRRRRDRHGRRRRLLHRFGVGSCQMALGPPDVVLARRIDAPRRGHACLGVGVGRGLL
jgi:hypothetical protein